MVKPRPIDNNRTDLGQPTSILINVHRGATPQSCVTMVYGLNRTNRVTRLKRTNRTAIQTIGQREFANLRYDNRGEIAVGICRVLEKLV